VKPYDNPSVVLNSGGKKRKEKISASEMGVLAPGPVHARPSARPPIDTSGNFPAHTSAESLF
jgi:hypothetical protein